MGRKRWWRGRSELLMLFIFHHVILGDGNVGCLFSKSLCNPRTETCYNDLAFGRCLPLYGDLTEEDYYQYDFNIDELELLRQELERLQIDGYKWSHPYTQCVMLTSLYNLRHRENYDVGQCQRLKQITHFEDDNRIDQTRVPAIAIVKFTPNDGTSRSEYANELFYPPGTREQYARGTLYNEEFPRSSYKDETREFPRLYEPRYASSSYKEYVPFINEENYEDRENTMRKKSFEEMNEKLYRTRRQPYNVRNYNDNPIESIKYALGEEAKAYPNQQDLSTTDTIPAEELEFLINKSYYNKKETDDDIDVEYEKAFSKKYKHPRKFSQFSDKDEFLLENVKRNSKNNDYDGEDYEDINEEIELPRKDISSLENAIYTEGGLVQANNGKTDSDAEENAYDPLFDNDLNEYLLRRELAGFKRRERLDVKKPGPPFSTNNYAFKNQLQSREEKETRSDSNETEQDDTFQNEELFEPFVKKEVFGQSEESSSASYHNVDLDHVYVQFEQPFHMWAEGEHVVEEVAKLLGLAPDTLTNIRIDRAEVTFQVVKNNKNYNATDVVNKIDGIRGKLKESLGVEVTRAGIGDKIKLPATLEVVRAPQMNSSVFGALVAAGVAAAGTAAIVTLLIARRHAKSRAKLAGLATPDPEASKDYQDLCRARMQAKLPTHKLDSPFTAKISLESESNNLPSNRSSTSSWGDEPASSNMDISTGKMVLSYMEDHLKNKDRLNQEWEVLRVHYPGSTEIAKSEENAKCNRPGTPLPYDHTRVILNDLANANNSDYINASTIVDHDPRNPAYIATQGPLPHTSADFWQLVWEQGSVVIVMLTRLTEDGVAMCHRYWPEEGSELYHIYEVHLVSEHFWCDDYLVRSFYLKNVRTGETRTVTQFHFLSWPENGVPYSTKALLEFRRKINKSYKGRSCPIVVHCRIYPVNQMLGFGRAAASAEATLAAGRKTRHLPGRSFWADGDSSVFGLTARQNPGTSCLPSVRKLLPGRHWQENTTQLRQQSDGVGRTGTYCLIDMVLNRMMKGAKEIDIASTLEHIRDQRPDMVATKQQFEFVLMAVAEEVHAILKALPAAPAEKSPPPGNNTSTKEGQ